MRLHDCGVTAVAFENTFDDRQAQAIAMPWSVSVRTVRLSPVARPLIQNVLTNVRSIDADSFRMEKE
jgi:hypothetical protein